MDMNSVVAKAAATISHDKFLQPLRALCVRKIALSLKFYVDSGVTSLHEHLKPKLCEEVLERFGEQVNHETFNLFRQDHAKLYTTLPNSQILKIASLFVHPKLECFNARVLCDVFQKPNFTKFDVEERSRFFIKLAEGAPNLTTFDYHHDMYDRTANCSDMLPSDYLNFGLMSKLNTLKLYMDIGFSDVDFQIIGANMPLLSYLDITLGESVTIEGGLEHLQQLKMLEYLVLSTPCEDVPGQRRGYSEQGISEFCLVKMPKLKIAAYDLHDDNISNLIQSHYFYFFEAMDDSPVELVLEHLKLWDDFPPENVLLPHVTHLLVATVDAVEFCMDRNFPKIKELAAYTIPYKDLKKLLKRFGHSLTKLTLTDMEGLCELLEILKLCPLLECLYIEGSCVKDIRFINPSAIRALNKMKKFRLRSKRSNGNEITGKSLCKAAGLLRLLMTSCPDLEELDLQLNIPRAEVDEVAAGIAAGAYLCLLKIKLVWVNFKPVFALKSMENFVIQMVMHCPKLNHIGVSNVRRSKFGALFAMMRRFDRGHVIDVMDSLRFVY